MANTIELLTSKDERGWDDFVMAHTSSTMYHLLGWRSIISEVYHLEPLYLVAKEKKNIVGIFPTFFVKAPFGAKKIVSLPYCNYGGPISRDTRIDNLFINYIKNNYSTNEIEIRSLSEKYNYPVKKGYITSQLSLNQSMDELWLHVDKDLRNQIRKAQKYFLNLRSGVDLIKDFYYLYGKTMKRLGTPGHGLEYFQKIIHQFPRESNIFVIYYQNKPIAGLFSFTFKKIFSDPWAASDSHYFYLCPNDFLYWKAIEWAKLNNLSYFDFGRSTINSGVHKFKKQWGAKTLPLYYYSLGKKTVQNFSKAEKIISKCWAILPISVTNTFGPFLRKYIP